MKVPGAFSSLSPGFKGPFLGPNVTVALSPQFRLFTIVVLPCYLIMPKVIPRALYSSRTHSSHLFFIFHFFLSIAFYPFLSFSFYFSSPPPFQGMRNVEPFCSRVPELVVWPTARKWAVFRRCCRQSTSTLSARIRRTFSGIVLLSCRRPPNYFGTVIHIQNNFFCCFTTYVIGKKLYRQKNLWRIYFSFTATNLCWLTFDNTGGICSLSRGLTSAIEDFLAGKRPSPEECNRFVRDAVL